MSGKGGKDTQYFYLKADPDHHDLEDIFKGKYDKNRKEWRFEKNQEDEVTRFMYCSSSESEEGLEDKFVTSNDNDSGDDDDDIQISEAAKEMISMKRRRRRDRLHRANSFNASDKSDEEHDSIDGRYRRTRPTRQKIVADVSKLKKAVENLEKK